MQSVDLNCDLGELEGDDGLQLERTILGYVTSANVACRAHAGDAARMRDIARLCKELGVAFGAHPGYPDRANFGRRVLPMSPREIYELVADQTKLAMEIAASEGVVLRHVKPHGALYNLAASDAAVAEAIVLAVRDAGHRILLYGLSGSVLIQTARTHGVVAVNEVFADRNYLPDGSLVPRDRADSVLSDSFEITERAVAIMASQKVTACDGRIFPLIAETICVHSDTVNAIEIARQLRSGLENNGIVVGSPSNTDLR